MAVVSVSKISYHVVKKKVSAPSMRHNTANSKLLSLTVITDIHVKI